MDHTEEEQLERLREWWSRNGKFVIAGVVVGLAAVIGTRMWTEARNSKAEAASQQYERLLGALGKRDSGQAEQLADGLLEAYGSTPYATLARLALARLKVEQGDLGAAAALLRQVVDGDGEAEIRQIARLRLARVLLADGKGDAALALLKDADSSVTRADSESVKGDIYLALGKRAEARAAYERAKALGGGNPRLLQMKLDDLAVADGEGEGALP